MASKRHKRRRGCEGKRRYVTIGAAITELNRARQREPGIRLNVYRCTACGMFHLGHQPAVVRRAIEERRAGC